MRWAWQALYLSCLEFALWLPVRVQATLSFAVRVAPKGATQVPVLLDTMRVWREAVRYVVDYVIRTRQTGLARVHRALYRLLRERYGLRPAWPKTPLGKVYG